MKRLSFLLFLAVSTLGAAQNADKYITRKSVSRVIETLSSDEMMGRPSTRPELMEKATAFIEKEFKSIELASLSGLKGYRQEFEKERISLEKLELIVDGQLLPDSRSLVVSENIEVNASSGFAVKFIKYDTSVRNKEEFFFSKVFPIINDTTHSLVLVSSEFEAPFILLKKYYATRFTRGKKGNTIFILGQESVSAYSIRAKQQIETIIMSNVVGQLPGKSKSNEVVIFSAHYDHIGIEQANAEGDSIANGADDDASGTTAVIELARYFKKIKNNERTLIFVAFTAEEVGDSGQNIFRDNWIQRRSSQCLILK